MTADGPLVLIVDDDAMVRRLARRALENAGCRVEEAIDGAVAIDAFTACTPDLVLIDVVMPKLDGFESCRQLRALEVGRHIPILMMTASSDVDSIHQAFEAGATDFVNKPLPLALLGYRVQYMLRAAQVVQELARSEVRLSAAQRVARVGYWEWDRRTDCLTLSAMTRQILGDEDGTALSIPLDGFLAEVDDDDRPRVSLALRQFATGDEPLSIEFRARGTEDELTDGNPTGHGEERWLHLQGDAAELPLRAEVRHGTLQDISEIKRSQAQTRYLAYFDILTGLPNRLNLHEQLEQWLSAARRHDRTMSVLVLDLDNFKQINETLGHAAGDRLLTLIATRLRTCVRTEDSISAHRGTGLPEAALARMGGDEFTLLLAELPNEADAERVASRLLEAIQQPIDLDGHEVVVSASVGISLYPLDGEDANTLLANADTAMYHAKSEGGNTASFYNTPMRAAAAGRFSMEMALRRALEREQFTLVYQPKLSLADGRITGVEALLRWDHPELGPTSPLDFIPVAEESGLIFAISDWVMRTVCQQIREWRHTSASDLRVAVNLSARQFREPALAKQLAALLSECGVDPSVLELEITESALMANPALAKTTTHALRELGCTVSIDDFGTGYSSLSYLKQLDVDCLKIDRSFISGLPDSAGDSAIVTAVTAMASSFGMRVIAEGVETAPQLIQLQRIGCHEVQGFLISRPVPASHLPAVLARTFDALGVATS